ncbi:MAG: hypothetical protein WCK78_00540 [Paludibacter sp.]
MRHLLFLFFLIIFTGQLVAQESVSKDKIILLSGESYLGEIVLKTDELIMLKTETGRKFQFQLSQIKSIEKTTIESSRNSTDDSQSTEALYSENFGGSLELSGGICGTRNAFSTSAITEISMIFGNKKINAKDLFFGLGASYQIIFPVGFNQRVNFIPVFIRMQSVLLKTNTSPYVDLDTGYSFGLTSGYEGGLFTKLSAGIIHKIKHKSDLYGSLFVGVNSIKTKVKETYDSGIYNYFGQTAMTSFGLKLGFHF